MEVVIKIEVKDNNIEQALRVLKRKLQRDGFFKSKQTVPELISSSSTVPGIKVDTGAKVLAGSPEEKITEGLDGLRERLKDYYKLGARFTKWRAVYNISNKYPSKLSIHSNAHALARYSAIVQECKMVPIVEPEVLMDGNHTAEDCFDRFSWLKQYKN